MISMRVSATRKGRRISIAMIGVLCVLAAVGGLLMFGPAIWALPTRYPLETTPADLGLKYETVDFYATDAPIRLRGWWMPAANPKGVVLIVHGVMSNRSFPRTERSGLYRDLVKNGFTVLAPDLRGYGESDEPPDGVPPYGAELAYDIIGAVDYAKQREPALPIAALGISVSAGAAIYAAAADTRIKAVISECAATDARSILLKEIPSVTGIPRVLAPALLWIAETFYSLSVDTMRPIDVISSLGARPVLVIHTQDDDLVPLDHAERLAEAANAGQLWVTGAPPEGSDRHVIYLMNRSHCRAYDSNPEGYSRRVVTFLDSLFLS